MSFNYWVSFTKAYQEFSITQRTITPYERNDILDDALFKVPESADQIFIIQNDSLVRE